MLCRKGRATTFIFIIFCQLNAMVVIMKNLQFLQFVALIPLHKVHLAKLQKTIHVGYYLALVEAILKYDMTLKTLHKMYLVYLEHQGALNTAAKLFLIK